MVKLIYVEEHNTKLFFGSEKKAQYYLDNSKKTGTLVIDFFTLENDGITLSPMNGFNGEDLL